MSMIQPGTGYGFNSSGFGFTLNVGSPFEEDGTAAPTAWAPTDNGDGTFSMYPGTINSIIPCIGNLGASNLLTAQTNPTPRASYNFNSSGTSYIYLFAGISPASAVPVWPCPDFSVVGYPVIAGFGSKQNDSDTYGHLLLAVAQKDPNAPSSPPPAVTFTRFVTNSVWSERHKYTQPNSAIYRYYRV